MDPDGLSGVFSGHLSKGRDMTTNKALFEMPGIKTAANILSDQLKSSSSYFDHILIKGPRGSGKSYLIQRVKDQFKLCDEIININCELLSKEQLQQWVHYERNEKRLVFLDKLEKLSPEAYKHLNGLMENVRVVAILMDNESQLPSEILENFQVIVDAPQLHKHRADILHFIAKKWPGRKISSIALIRLCAYHWPGNFRELDRAVWQWFSTGKLPKEITGEDKLHSIFISLLDSGIELTELELAINTCFACVVPLVDEMFKYRDLELKYASNASYGIEVHIGPTLCVDSSLLVSSDQPIDLASPRTVLNYCEIQLILKSFFQLVFGEFAMLHNENLYDLKPFRENSLVIIKWYQQVVNGWEVGFPCPELEGLLLSASPSFNNSYCPLPHFANQLSQKQIDAVTSFLVACENICKRNIIKSNSSNFRHDQSQPEHVFVETNHGKNNRQEAEEDTRVASENYFKNNGSTWEICFQGKKLPPVVASVNIKTIAERLQYPHKEKELSLSTGRMPVIDSKTQVAIEEELQDLRERYSYNRKESSSEKCLEITAKVEKIRKSLKVYGAAINDNWFVSWFRNNENEDYKKERKAYQTQINRGIDTIHKTEGGELLAEYLKMFLKKHYYYTPAPETAPWSIYM